MFKKLLQKLYDKFGQNPDAMITVTSCLGWALSSAAQIFSIQKDPHRTDEEKKFLIPQEIFEAIFNVGALFLITKASSKAVGKLFETGKWAPKQIRTFLNENAKKFKNKVGTIDFSVSKELEGNKDLSELFTLHKTAGKTIATVVAAIISTNIITPIARNYIASKCQNKYKQNNLLEKEALNKNNKEQTNNVPRPNFKSVSMPINHSYGLRI